MGISRLDALGVLGLQEDADHAKIKATYKKLAVRPPTTHTTQTTFDSIRSQWLPWSPARLPFFPSYYKKIGSLVEISDKQNGITIGLLASHVHEVGSIQ